MMTTPILIFSIVLVLTSVVLSLFVLMHKGRGGGMSDLFGGGMSSSMGGASDSIPVRLGRGEPVDVVIVIDSAFDPLIKAGHIVAGSRVQLARSVIGAAVRKGAPKPDISTVAALRQTLLQATSIAYSASASGTYISTEMFARLGIADQVKGKARRIESERVGTVAFFTGCVMNSMLG